jgi:hypothetical protein
MGYLISFTPLAKAFIFTVVACLSSDHEVVVDGSDVVLHHVNGDENSHVFLTDCVTSLARNDEHGDHRIFCGAQLHTEAWEKSESECSEEMTGGTQSMWESSEQGVFYLLCCQAPRGPCVCKSDLFLSQWNSVKLVI